MLKIQKRNIVQIYCLKPQDTMSRNYGTVREAIIETVSQFGQITSEIRSR